MLELSLVRARSLIDGALAAARSRAWKPMAVVVVDASAQVIASAREDGASALRLDIALGKAAAAVGMGVNSRVLAQRAKELPAFFGAVAAAAQQKFIPQTGAVLILDAQSAAVLGAAGASGGTGDEDEAIVIAGMEAAGLRYAVNA